MQSLKNNTRVNIGIPNINIDAHWAYYIAGSLFIVLAIISIIYTYYFITRSLPEKSINEHTGFKKFWLKNRVSFFIMADVICVLIAIFFMINGS